MTKTLEELDERAKNTGFADAEHAVNLADSYRMAYSEYLHKYDALAKVFKSLQGLLPYEMNALINLKLKEEEMEDLMYKDGEEDEEDDV